MIVEDALVSVVEVAVTDDADEEVVELPPPVELIVAPVVAAVLATAEVEVTVAPVEVPLLVADVLLVVATVALSNTRTLQISSCANALAAVGTALTKYALLPGEPPSHWHGSCAPKKVDAEAFNDGDSVSRAPINSGAFGVDISKTSKPFLELYAKSRVPWIAMYAKPPLVDDENTPCASTPPPLSCAHRSVPVVPFPKYA